MKVIGLTGGTGSGKGFVCEVLEKKGAYIIDADSIAHNIYLKGKPAYFEIIDCFGDGILDRHGEIDRRVLGGIVFSSVKKLHILNSCTHKYIENEIKDIINNNRDKEIIILDAPLLLEGNFKELCDEIWAVYADESVRRERIIKRDSITEQMALNRMSSQKDWNEYATFAHKIIDNSVDGENAEKHIEEQIDSIL